MKKFNLLLIFTLLTSFSCKQKNNINFNFYFDNSVFKILNMDAKNYYGGNIISQGTGFFIDNKGTFVTNAHVVEDSYFLKAKMDNNNAYYEIDKIYHYNYNNSDYAIGHVNLQNSKPVKFTNKFSSNEKVYTISYPNNSVINQVTSGKIYGEKIVENKKYIVNDAVIHEGSSGGILSNSKGEVLGLTSVSFGNNYFGAIPYNDFANNLTNKTINKFPSTFSKNGVSIALNPRNINDYFYFNIYNTKKEGIYLNGEILLKNYDIFYMNESIDTLNTIKIYYYLKIKTKKTNGEYETITTESTYTTLLNSSSTSNRLTIPYISNNIYSLSTYISHELIITTVISPTVHFVSLPY